jgi:DNA polymerase
VWGDLANIEARVLPWLAGPASRSAQRVLEVFYRADADPKANPDVYCLAAAGIDQVDIDTLWQAHLAKEDWAKSARQKGKIAVLSLGFGGGSGALLNMAANYGMSFAEEEASAIVKGWRQSNPWAGAFWDKVWDAFGAAFASPGVPQLAGRLTYIGVPYLGEVSVLCILPDGRALCYRDVKHGLRERTWPDGRTSVEPQYTFSGAYGRKGLWYGTLVENATQATAASILRAALADLEDADPRLGLTRGHTHDEIVRTAPERLAGEARAHLREVMAAKRPWAEGLPVEADTHSHWYYTKALD